MYTFETQMDINWKDGTRSPAGTSAVVKEWPEIGNPLVEIGGTPRVVSPKIVGKLIAGYVPDLEELEEWSSDGVCETPTGASVEPDGYDEHGIPSWLLILGFI